MIEKVNRAASIAEKNYFSARQPTRVLVLINLLDRMLFPAETSLKQYYFRNLTTPSPVFYHPFLR